MIRALIFDWGDTIMREFAEYEGAMVTWPRVALIPGADRALAELSQRFPCCLASNAGISNAELMGQALERVNVRQYFQHLWTSKELGVAKPDPGFFLGITERLGLEPGQAVMIGNDYTKDIAGAKGAGLKTVWLNEAGLPLPGPAVDVVIRTLDELPAAIAGL
ncbi:MAG TPA: HAD-IA family hydrolase [Symbiobacteriaceae bacterium]|nr:HAD-IA family hydrolase [Symbiobacteriaceae bacterium]